MSADFTKILMVDDEEDILTLYSMILGDDFDVFVAQSGQEAIEIKNKENIKIIYTDLNILGMSGKELCEEIRKTDSFSVICAITGYTDFFHSKELRSVGFDDFLTKPVDEHDLRKSIEESVARVARWGVDHDSE